MTEKGYGPHLAVMRDAIQAIERYRPADQATFLADPMCQDAVLMRLQVIGEHLGRLRQMDEERFFALADASWFHVIGLPNVIPTGTKSSISPESGPSSPMTCPRLPKHSTRSVLIDGSRGGVQVLT